jgi:hypothetical protein
MSSRLTFLLFLLCFSLTGNILRAQCAFTPTITPANLILCPNESDTLWTESYDSYQWYKAGMVVPGATLQYYVVDAFNDAGNYFKVEVTQSACTEMSDSVLVDGWAFLPPFVISEGNFTLCPGQDSVIFILGQPYTDNIQWMDNGAAIPGANDDTLIVYGAGSFTVEGTPPQCPNFVQTLGVSLDVTLYQPPVITPQDLVLCSGGTDTLFVVASPGYQWYRDGVAIPGATQSFYITDTSGAFTITTTEGGCSLSDTANVTEYNATSPVISVSGTQLISTPGAPTLTNFQWYLGGVAISGATNSSYTPAQSGTYTVEADDNSCHVISQPFSFTSQGIPGLGNNNDVEVYPNPVTSYLTIKAKQPVDIGIYSLDGKKIKEAMNAQAIDLSSLAPGIYVARVTDRQGKVLKNIKISKTK